MSTDAMSTDCDRFREALSARLDGEGGPVEPAELDAHVAVCAGCRNYGTSASVLARQLRVGVAPQVPDLTADILAAVPAEPPRARRRRQWRGVLVLAAIAQLVLAVPTLVTAAGVHTSREVAIFQVALAVGFLVAAWRPVRAGGLFPVVAAATVLAVIASVADVAAGVASVASEATHLLEVVGAVALWVLDRDAGPILQPHTT